MSADRMLREIVVAPSRSSARAMDTSSESPSTLSEIPRVLSPRSEPPEPTREPNRRWFSNEDYDLFVWFDELGAIRKFELCYDCSDVERALTWSPLGGYRRWRVDTGEATGLNYDMTPILVPDDAEFPKDRVTAAFAQAANTVEPTILSFVVQRLQDVPLSEQH